MHAGITPPHTHTLGVGLEIPPGQTPQTPPWVWAWRPPRPDPQLPHWVWAWRPLLTPQGPPGNLQGMLGYAPWRPARHVGIPPARHAGIPSLRGQTDTCKASFYANKMGFAMTYKLIITRHFSANIVVILARAKYVILVAMDTSQHSLVYFMVKRHL